jgi:hypothetical protein
MARFFPLGAEVAVPAGGLVRRGTAGIGPVVDVAGLVSRINMIRRPDLLLQVAVFSTLAAEKLKSKTSYKSATQPQVENRKPKHQNLPAQAAPTGRKAAAPNPKFPACWPW